MGVFGKHCYDYPRPAFTADVVVFSFIDNILKVLLIERKNDPYQGFWALPGGFVDENEIVANAAERELQEETGLKINKIDLFFIASDPGRDPRGWVISAIYLGFVSPEKAIVRAGDDAGKVGFHSLRKIPALAFDHKKILEAALRKLKTDIRHQIINPDILSESFEISELESLYSQIIESQTEARQLTERLKNFKIILPTGKDNHYSFDLKLYKVVLEFGFLQP
jgi:8-oxo-dGTP diphosphatase